MSIQAVLTGDIVNSTRLSKAKEKLLTKKISALFANDVFEFYRGDSFQAYLQNPQQALTLALLCRATAISLFKENQTAVSDIRVSIGIGEIDLPVKNLKTAKGEAFILSGRKFDEIMTTQERISITGNNELANVGFNVISGYLENIFSKMTGKQAEVIVELLIGETQLAIAQKLNKTQSTIHQRVTAARWPEIEKLLQHYNTIINLLQQ